MNKETLLRSVLHFITLLHSVSWAIAQEFILTQVA